MRAASALSTIAVGLVLFACGVFGAAIDIDPRRVFVCGGDYPPYGGSSRESCTYEGSKARIQRAEPGVAVSVAAANGRTLISDFDLRVTADGAPASSSVAVSIIVSSDITIANEADREGTSCVLSV